MTTRQGGNYTIFYRVFSGLWKHQKSLKTNSSWFIQTEIIDADRKTVQRTFIKQLKNPAHVVVAGESVCFNSFSKKQRNETKTFSRKSKSRKVLRLKSIV